VGVTVCNKGPAVPRACFLAAVSNRPLAAGALAYDGQTRDDSVHHCAIGAVKYNLHNGYNSTIGLCTCRSSQAYNHMLKTVFTLRLIPSMSQRSRPKHVSSSWRSHKACVGLVSLQYVSSDATSSSNSSIHQHTIKCLMPLPLPFSFAPF